ncbi:unnamed protein product [Toxocara canis]|uniref:CA domain-containing protein n=1 Tax=Toxocara canis TaxID=6265 RepID=A0A183VCX3_TOXCA|nr:unnamed protein product [Toxocara canis]
MKKTSKKKKTKKYDCRLPLSLNRPFYIGVDEISGEIIVKSGLDYERRTSYDFVAIPVDGSQAIHVYVRVLDENDNAPTFPVPFVNFHQCLCDKAEQG